MKMFATAAALIALVGGVGAGLVEVIASHSDAVATAVCTASVLPSAPLIDRYCPRPGQGYVEGYGGPVRPSAVRP